MVFLQLTGISIRFGPRTVLNDVSLNITQGSRLALSGANGSGKSTLMKVAAGIIQADSGTVSCSPGAAVSYLPQSGLVHKGEPLRREAERAFDRLAGLERHKQQIEQRLSGVSRGDPEIPSLVETQHDLQEKLDASGYYRRDEQIERVLTGLGFAQSDLTRDTAEFSGGWQMRIALAKTLLERPDVMLLDEPTNYLDLEARNWLEEFLASFEGGLLIVAHDRYFLDVTVTGVVELFGGSLKRYNGNYSDYERKRDEQLQALTAAYDRQQEEIQRMEEFIRRFRYNESKARLVQSRIKQLEKMERIEIPESMKSIGFRFPDAPHSGKKVLRFGNVCRTYGSTEVLTDVNLEIERGERVVIVGKNGSGKSTLMRIIAGVDLDFDGTLRYGAGVALGYFSQAIDTLDGSGSVIEEAESTAPTHLYPTLRNLLGAFLFRGDDIYKPVSVLSGGERNRLALLKLLLNPVNLLVLDEPTNHLDMASKDVLLQALLDYGGTLVFVSHDRYFIDRLATRVVELTETGWRDFPGGYDYYLWRTRQEQEGHEGPQGQEEDAVGRTSQRTPRKSENGREERKRLRSRKTKLEREVAYVMEELEQLEAAHEKWIAELAKEEVYTDGQRTKRIKDALSENEKKQASLSDRWHSIESELSELAEHGDSQFADSK